MNRLYCLRALQQIAKNGRQSRIGSGRLTKQSKNASGHICEIAQSEDETVELVKSALDAIAPRTAGDERHDEAGRDDRRHLQ